MRQIIGIGGYSGSGKDAVASILVEHIGAVRLGFADALKEEVASILRTALIEYLLERGTVQPSDPVQKVDQTIYNVLWVNRTPMTRCLLQAWGSELRRAEQPDYWLAAWQRRAEKISGVIVVPDTRFANEAAWIRERGGILVRVDRPSCGPVNGHSSDNSFGLIQWDYVLPNAGTIEDLCLVVKNWWSGLPDYASSRSLMETPDFATRSIGTESSS